eukprot:gene5243-5907_t
MNISSLQFCATSVIVGTFSDDTNSAHSKRICEEIAENRTLDPCLEIILQRIVATQPAILNDRLLCTLLSGGIRLKNLMLRKCINISLVGLAMALENQPNIEHLDLSECNQLTNPVIANILAKRTPALRSLIFESTYTMKDPTVQAIFRNCTNLTLLSLACSPFVSENVFSCFTSENDNNHVDNDAINNITSSLTNIDFSCCKGMSATTIRQLAVICGPNLKTVNISWTNIDCIALVYLCGYSLSSAVFLATNAHHEDVPFTVAEMEASQQFEFQMISKHNASVPAAEEKDLEISPPCEDETDVILRASDNSMRCDDKVRDEKIDIGVEEKFFSSENSACSGLVSLEKINETALFEDIAKMSLDGDIPNGSALIMERAEINNSVDCVRELETFEAVVASLNTDPADAEPFDNSQPEITAPSPSLTVPLQDENGGNCSMFVPRQMFQCQITELDISEISFIDYEVGSDCLKKFVTTNHHLRVLKISWKLFDDNLLGFIAKNEPELVDIGLEECEGLTNYGLKLLGTHCQKLYCIDLQGVPFVSDEGLLEVLRNGLVCKLSLAECAVTDVTLRNIVRFCSSTIKDLNLSWCENLTDDEISNLICACPQLESLNLRQCEASLKSTNALAENSPSNLTYLELCSIQELMDSMVLPFLPNMKQLVYIDLSWNCMLTDETVSKLFICCPLLREAVLSGLKRISTKPFLPIISGLVEWRAKREIIAYRLRTRGIITRNIASQEVNEPDFYLPHRSVNYVPNLKKLDVSFSDKVNDTFLAEIVAVCRGTLKIEDYYSVPINPRWLL